VFGVTTRCWLIALVVILVGPSAAGLVQPTFGQSAFAHPALALSRPTAREIDVLLALIEAEVPVAAWAAVDAPMDRYRVTIAERLELWERQPALYRPVATIPELESTRRDRRRRLQTMRSDQRTLVAEMHAALLEFAAANPGAIDDMRCVDEALLWLETRVASHAVERARAGHVHPLPFPKTLMPGDDMPRSLLPMLASHRRAYVVAAEAVLSAWSDIAPAMPQVDRDGVEDRELVEAKARGEMEHEAAVTALAHVVAVIHADILRIVEQDRASAVGHRLATDLTIRPDPHAEAMAVARRLAPTLPGLDEEGRTRLRAAADAYEKFERDVAEQAQRELLRSVEAGRPPRGAFEPEGERHLLRDRWTRAARELLGDRYNLLVQAVWSGRDATAALRELVDEDAFDKAISLPSPTWQMRLNATSAASTARYRSLAAARGVSEQLRRRLHDLARNDADRAAALAKAIGEHDRRWSDQIEPLQAQVLAAIDDFGALSADEDALARTSTVTGALESLRLSIGDAERRLAEAVRSTGADAFDAERWILDRSIELYAPPAAHDQRAMVPMAAMPQTIDEVIQRAGLPRGDANSAWGVAIAHVDALVSAAIDRQARLEALCLWRTRREVAFRRMMRFGPRDPLSAALADELEGLTVRLGLHLESMDAPLVDAWEALHADWAIALPQHAGTLRDAWLAGLMPSLAADTVPTGTLIDRLRGRLSPDDPRSTALAELASVHHRERERRIAATTEASMRLPQSVARYQLSVARLAGPDQRGDALRRARIDETEAGVRALRHAISIVGVEEALRDQAIITALAWIALQ